MRAPRRRPSSRLMIGITVAMLALLVPTVGSAPGATKKKKHKVDVSVRAARVASSADGTTVAGTFDGKPFGSGAAVYMTRAAGSDLAARVRAFTAKGSLRGTSLVTPAPQPDGTVSFSGTLQVKGGTGRYRGARGKDLQVTGTFNPQENLFTFHITGTVRY